MIEIVEQYKYTTMEQKKQAVINKDKIWEILGSFVRTRGHEDYLAEEDFEGFIENIVTVNKKRHRLISSLGGKARAKKLTPQRRKEIATKASHSRKSFLTPNNIVR